jgi:malonyl-CoA/methylmalonyl-CoA synthetase
MMARENNVFDRLLASGRDGSVLTDETGRSLAWPDIATATAQLGRAFAEAGLVPGDRLAVCAAKSNDSFLLYLAALRAGLGYVPVNTSYSGREVENILSSARPAAVIFTAHKPEVGEVALRLGVPRPIEWTSGAVEELAVGCAAEPVAAAETNPDDLAVLIFTSGTTGRPKGAMLSHRNLISNCADLGNIWRLGRDDVVLHALPIFHGHGLFAAGTAPLMAGAGLLLLPRFDADSVIDRLGRATVMMGVPTFYSRLLDSPRLRTANLERMRLFICGSAPMPGELAANFARLTGHRVLERYGTSETGIISSHPIGDAQAAGTVGTPLPSTVVRIADETGTPLPEGHTGAVEVRGPAVFKGYWQDPESTRAAFREDGFFITGDLGLFVEGRLKLVGRQKDLIISGGYNVYAKELENVFDCLPGVAESAIVGVPHPDFGEAVVAVIVPEPGVSDLVELAELVRQEARKQLSNYKIPKSVQISDELPRNAMGKVLKAMLRANYEGLFGGPNASFPRNVQE